LEGVCVAPYRGGPRYRSGLIRLGFLGPWPFRSEDPDSEGWISLDFLGFSRPNRDFSMSYEP
jgi:hypothetical protein